METEAVAYLRVRRLDTREVVGSVGLSLYQIQPHVLQRIMLGMLTNMNMDEYFIDDSEVDAVREQGGEEENE